MTTSTYHCTDQQQFICNILENNIQICKDVFQHRKICDEKKTFSSFPNSPPQSTHPCWEANVFLSAFQVSSPYVAQNDPATQWQWSNMRNKGLIFSEKNRHYTNSVTCHNNFHFNIIYISTDMHDQHFRLILIIHSWCQNAGHTVNILIHDS